MKISKMRFLLCITFLMTFTIVSGSFGATSQAHQSADKLYTLGLFSGTGVDQTGKPIYDLDRAPTRQEAITMLVKLLGKENVAKNGSWSHPFNDVDKWAQPYVGYAYNAGLTAGISQKMFGSKDSVTEAQYLTFILKALGYDPNKDFNWENSYLLSDNLGITNGEHNSNSIFTRGDITLISFNSLNKYLKGSQIPLIVSLYFNDVIKIDKLKEVDLSKFITLDLIYEHLNKIDENSTDTKKDFRDFIKPINDKPFIIAQNNNHYLIDGSIQISKDINDNYYTYVKSRPLSDLLSFAYGDYDVVDSPNPYVDGMIQARPNTDPSILGHSYGKYSLIKTVYTSVNSSYKEYIFYNHDLSKNYTVKESDNRYMLLIGVFGQLVLFDDLENQLGDVKFYFNTTTNEDFHTMSVEYSN